MKPNFLFQIFLLIFSLCILQSVQSQNSEHLPSNFKNSYSNPSKLSFLNKVTGSIKRRDGTEIEATVTLYKENVFSEEIYGSKFQFNPSQGKYAVCPRRDDNHLNGVSTADIVKIQRHILGLEPLTHPYLLLAADVNASNAITAADVSEIRRMILGITTKFGKVPSWVFIPQDTSFTNILPNPKFFGTYCNSFTLDINTLINIDYHAIKMGDVTESAKNSNLNESHNRNQSTNLFYNTLDNDKDFLRTNFTLNNDFDLAGMQFTLSFKINEYEFIQIENGSMKLFEEQYSLHDLDKGRIHIAWNANPLEESSSSNINLFSIIWKKKSTGNENSFLRFDPLGITSLLVDENLNEFSLQIKNTDTESTPIVTVNQDFTNQSLQIFRNTTVESQYQYSIINLNGQIMTNGVIFANESILIRVCL